MDEIICTECGAEPEEGEHTRASLTGAGWELDGEFGEKCPECVAEARKISAGTAGLDDLAEALGAKKKES
jgi:hypothetical protein